MNANGTVDLQDFHLFVACTGRATEEPICDVCNRADFDNDGNVDFADFAIYQLGHGPAAATCGNVCVELTEACDDGNSVSGDGCGTDCCLEIPGPDVFRGFFSSSDTALLASGGPIDRILAAGVDQLAVKLQFIRPEISASDRNRLAQWAAKANEYGARLWVMINWYAAGELPWTDPERYVGPDGVTLDCRPCPQSEPFWTDAVTSRFVALAKLANIVDPDDSNFVPGLNQALEAVMLDPELYECPTNGQNYMDPCYCDSCFADFCGVIPIECPSDLPASQRFGFLEQNGLVESYELFERDAVETLARRYRVAFHAADPDLKIGGTSIIRFDRSPFYLGMGLGFGTADKPVYDWTQETYSVGFNSDIIGLIDEVAANNIHAVMVPGMLINRIPPAALADHYYTLATQTGSAWINSADFLDSLSNLLCHPVADYYDSIENANAELDVFEGEHCHVSSYRGVPFVPGCVDSQPYQPITTLTPVDSGPAQVQGALIRRETAYQFYATAGEDLSFDVCFRRFGAIDAASGWIALAAPDDELLSSAPLTEPFSPVPVRHQAAQTGIHTLLINTASRHGFRINNASHPGSYKVLGSRRLGVFQGHTLPTPQFYAFVPPGVNTVEMLFFSAGNELAIVRVSDERDTSTVLFRQCINGNVQTRFTLNIPTTQAATVWHWKLKSSAIPLVAKAKTSTSASSVGHCLIYRRRGLDCSAKQALRSLSRTALDKNEKTGRAGTHSPARAANPYFD